MNLVLQSARLLPRDVRININKNNNAPVSIS